MSTDDNRPDEPMHRPGDGQPGGPGQPPPGGYGQGSPPPGPAPPPPGPPPGQPYQGQPYQGQPGWAPPAPPKKRRVPRLLIVLGAVIAVCCLAGIVYSVAKSGNNATNTVPSNQAGPSQPGQSQQSAPGAAGPNQPVRDGKFEFTVKRVQCGQASVGEDPLTQTAEGQFCVVSMTVKNIGDQQQTFLDQDQRALSPDGTQYHDDTVAGIVAQKNNPLAEPISPGNQVNVALVYDIPKSAQINRLQLHDSSFSRGVEVKVG